MNFHNKAFSNSFLALLLFTLLALFNSGTITGKDYQIYDDTAIFLPRKEEINVEPHHDESRQPDHRFYSRPISQGTVDQPVNFYPQYRVGSNTYSLKDSNVALPIPLSPVSVASLSGTAITYT